MGKIVSVILSACLLLLSSCSKGGDLALSFKPTQGYKDDVDAFVLVKAAGAWSLSCDSPLVTFYPPKGSGTKSDVIMSFSEWDGEGDRSFSVTLTSDGQSVSRVFVQHSYEDPMKGSSSGESTRYKGAPQNLNWMELPATDAGTDLITHYFPLDGKVLRNYSFSWNQKYYISNWVAYCMSGAYPDRKVGRADSVSNLGDAAWKYDPVLGEEHSSAPFGGYCGRYDRGHQIPSEDRQCCLAANEQTFYGSNMTPQLSGFNQKIWATLEAKVRSWAARSDTLYVVTGCVLESFPETSPDSDGNRVGVPKAYYKALLRYSAHSNVGFADYCALGVFLEHRDNYENNITISQAMSIDELEARTGVDFFVNLPAKIGKDLAAKVEAQVPRDSNWWF